MPWYYRQCWERDLLTCRYTICLREHDTRLPPPPFLSFRQRSSSPGAVILEKVFRARSDIESVATAQNVGKLPTVDIVGDQRGVCQSTLGLANTSSSRRTNAKTWTPRPIGCTNSISLRIAIGPCEAWHPETCAWFIYRMNIDFVECALKFWRKIHQIWYLIKNVVKLMSVVHEPLMVCIYLSLQRWRWKTIYRLINSYQRFILRTWFMKKP